ncbi:MAG: hypothetical protein HYY17_02590 [Planctomycetes bacterium]|nr:hypothetical protein [Planctomycetota bacterium]
MNWVRANRLLLASFAAAYGTAALVTFVLTWPLAQFCTLGMDERIALPYLAVTLFCRYWIFLGLIGAGACLAASHVRSRGVRWGFVAACGIAALGDLTAYWFVRPFHLDG